MTSKGSRSHRFGGAWTDAKLDVLEKYLKAYTTALKKQTFKKGYIDAFAGTGYRDAKLVGNEGRTSVLFHELAEEDSQDLLDGSARIALRTEPRFDNYIFIEKSAKRCAELEQLKDDFSELADNISIRHQEANGAIRELCQKDWSHHRAVLFLDPYGMQVEWETIESIAQTKAIDLWLLFPLGIGVNRLLKRDADLPKPWRMKLDSLLGTSDWYDEFYRTESEKSLFGEPVERVVKASTDVIGRYFNERLKSVFAGVVDKPGVLRNSSNNPLYLFCFACSNPAGTNVALKIARDLLKGLR